MIVSGKYGGYLLHRSKLEVPERKSYDPVSGVMELDGLPLITHDDRLLLRAQKHKIGLWSNWKEHSELAWKDHAPVVVAYHHIGDVTKVCREIPDGEDHLWLPQYERTVPIPGVRISLKNNQLDVELLDLQNDLRSRYRKSLDVLAEMERVGVVKYKPSVSEPSERNIREALRHRMRRYAKVTAYEHNLIFRGDLGRRMMEALRSHDRAPEPYDGTVYLKGYKQYDGLTVSQKFYDVTKRESRDDPPEANLYKLETTLHKAYFKARGLRDVGDFIEQPDIQERLSRDLQKQLASVLRLCVEDGMDLKQFGIDEDLVGRDAPRRVACRILTRELTLTERVHALERKTREHDDRLDKIERHLRDRSGG